MIASKKKNLFLIVFSLANFLFDRPLFSNTAVNSEKSFSLTTQLSSHSFKSTLVLNNGQNSNTLTVTENRFSSLTERILEFKNEIGTLTGIARMRPWSDGLIRFYSINRQGKEVFRGALLQKNSEGHHLYDEKGQKIAYAVATALRNQVIGYLVQKTPTGEICLEATYFQESADKNQWMIRGADSLVPLIVARIVYDMLQDYHFGEAQIALGAGAALLMGFAGYTGLRHAGFFQSSVVEPRLHSDRVTLTTVEYKNLNSRNDLNQVHSSQLVQFQGHTGRKCTDLSQFLIRKPPPPESFNVRQQKLEERLAEFEALHSNRIVPLLAPSESLGFSEELNQIHFLLEAIVTQMTRYLFLPIRHSKVIDRLLLEPSTDPSVVGSLAQWDELTRRLNELEARLKQAAQEKASRRVSPPENQSVQRKIFLK